MKKGDFLLQIDKAQYDATTKAQQANLDALFAQRESDRATREQAERDYEREREELRGEDHLRAGNLQKAQARARLGGRLAERGRAPDRAGPRPAPRRTRTRSSKTTLVAPMTASSRRAPSSRARTPSSGR